MAEIFQIRRKTVFNQSISNKISYYLFYKKQTRFFGIQGINFLVNKNSEKIF